MASSLLTRYNGATAPTTSQEARAMSPVPYVHEFGMGVDLHGGDVTKAARPRRFRCPAAFQPSASA